MTSAEPHTNGKLHLGPNGSIIFVGAELDLAGAMRRVVFPAVCYIDEAGRIKDAVDRRAVVVVHFHPSTGSVAQSAATWIEQNCHAERVGILDMTELGFTGPADSFVAWWEEASGIGHFDDGPDFVHQAERRAKWRERSPIIIDSATDDDAVADPIGEIDPAAFYGPLGRLALATQPETEANPVFVLAHLLAYFGASVGRAPHFTVAATRHRLNLFVGLIGPSGIGRKGMAGDVATEVWRKVDPLFASEGITDGLNSGAGLLWHLRDATHKRNKDGDRICTDEGVQDKRRMFLETELAAVLKQGHRENDPITEHLRKFFDGAESVGSKVRSDPLKVTGGHIGIVGHCTPADLEMHLTDADKANGTANRFIWLFGVRARILPRGGDIFALLDFLEGDLGDVVKALEFARDVREIKRDRRAEERWEGLYRGEWTNVPTGRLGAFFARAAPHVMRLASVYAVSDRSHTVRLEHLEAALALWDHSTRSLRFVFGADADPDAEKLLEGLKAGPDEGLTKTQIAREVFHNNRDAETINGLLKRLLAYRIVVAGEPASKGGRPTVRYQLNRW